MQVFVAWDGDHIGRQVGRAALANDVEGLRRISQAIDHGNTIWRSWVEANGGSIISYGGDEGRAELPADKLQDLPKIRKQYADYVGSAVSVGVGSKLSEADRALLCAKLRGGDRIVLWTPEIDAEVEQKQTPRTEAAKLQDEYLQKGEDEQGPQQPGLHRGSVHAGMTNAHHAAPQKPPTKAHVEGSEHSQGEAADRFAMDHDPGSPEKTHTSEDYEQLFHAVAQARGNGGDGQLPASGDDLKQKVAGILKEVRQQAPILGQLKDASPEAYEAIMEMVQAMIEMAKQVTAGEQPMQKAEGETPPVSPALPAQLVVVPKGPTRARWEYHISHKDHLHIYARNGIVAHPSYKHVHDQPVVMRFLDHPTLADGNRVPVESIQLQVGGNWLPFLAGMRLLAEGSMKKHQEEKAAAGAVLAKGLFREAGFRHQDGSVFGTGPFHNIFELPEGVDVDSLEAGFIDQGGQFYTRAEAAAAQGRAEGAKLQSEDMRDQGLGREAGQEHLGGGAGLVKSEPAGKTDENAPPENEADYFPMEQWENNLRSQYVKDGKAVENSRLTPYSGPLPKVGTWAMDKYKGLHGREIAQLRHVDPQCVEGCEDPFEMGRGEDVHRYMQWLSEGKQAPPMNVIVNHKGTYRISDGHRRLTAHRMAGNKPLLAWVWPTMPHPQGLKAHGEQEPMQVGLTYEGLTEQRKLGKALPMPHANPHHHIPHPIGTTNAKQQVKVQHRDAFGKPAGTGWVQVQDGQVLSQDGHTISSRNPNAR